MQDGGHTQWKDPRSLMSLLGGYTKRAIRQNMSASDIMEARYKALYVLELFATKVNLSNLNK